MAYIPQSVSKQVEYLFNKFDSDGDEKITFFEIYNVLRDEGVENPELTAFTLFESLDKNLNGYISLKELQTIKLDEFSEKVGKRVVSELDYLLNETSSNTNITFDEVYNILKNDKEYSIDAERISTFIFKVIDKNNDNIIEVDEIKKYASSLNEKTNTSDTINSITNQL